MFALRRVAARRSLAVAPTSILPSRPPPLSSRCYSLAASKWCLQPRVSSSIYPFQRRWTSGEEKPAESETMAEEDAVVARAEALADGTAQSTVTESEQAEFSAAAERPQEGIEQEPEPEFELKTGPAAEALGEDAQKWTTQRERDHEEQQPPHVVDKNSVFVGNIFYDVTEKMLMERFAEYGEVESTKIAIDRRGLSRGFGWVHYNNEESANAAMADANSRMWEGRLMSVMPATRKERPNRQPGAAPGRRGGRWGATADSLAYRPRNPPSETLFIGNMSYEMTDADLNDLFQPIENVADVRVAIDRRTGQPRGFAHADFVTVEAAEAAAKILAQKKIYGRTLRVDFSTSYSQRGSGESE